MNTTVFAAGSSEGRRDKIGFFAKFFAGAFGATAYQLDAKALDVSLGHRIRAAMELNGKQELIVVHDGGLHGTNAETLKKELATVKNSRVFLTFIHIAGPSSRDTGLLDVLRQSSHPVVRHNVTSLFIEPEGFESVLQKLYDLFDHR